MQEQEQSNSGTSDTKEKPNQYAHIDPLKELAESLNAERAARGEPAGKPEGEGGEPKPAAKGKPIRAFNDLAESLKMSLDDLYKLEISGADGTKHTIESLKGLLAERDDLTVRSLRFENSVREKEAAMLRAEQEFTELMGMLPESVLTKQVTDKLGAKVAARLAAEREKTLRAIPEWHDDVTEAADRKALKEHLADFGYPENFLDTVTDHRALRYMRANMLRDKRIAEALSRIQERKPKTPAKSGPVAERKGKQPSPPILTPYDRNVAAFRDAINQAGKQQ